MISRNRVFGGFCRADPLRKYRFSTHTRQIIHIHFDYSGVCSTFAFFAGLGIIIISLKIRADLGGLIRGEGVAEGVVVRWFSLALVMQCDLGGRLGW
eukprot:COSAG02_NODE_5998_length_3883_cov_3.934214_5_plen_97_part_00